MGGLRDNLHERASLEQLFDVWFDEARKKGSSDEILKRDLLFAVQRWLEEQAAAHRIWKKPEAVEALYEAIHWRLRRRKPHDEEDPAIGRIQARAVEKAERQARRKSRKKGASS